MYRANYGNGETGEPHQDIRDARLDKWGRAAIVQYRTAIERHVGSGHWVIQEPSRASQNGPVITELRGRS